MHGRNCYIPAGIHFYKGKKDMSYNFDEIIDRDNTASVKFGLRKEIFGIADVHPMWVADMDFAVPGFIRDAIIERAKHPIYGYTFRPPVFFESIISWMSRRHGWDIDKSWISFSPGIVPALNMIVLTFTEPGDRIILQPPVYFPFFTAVKNHGREIVHNRLVNRNGRYYMDFEDLEEKAKNAKMLILCHPHNPVGRVWTKEELTKLVEICRRNGVLIISDEIHSDLILGDNKHIPVLTIAGAEEIAISCYAPSKTFNLAGLSTSYLITPSKDLRRKYEKTLDNLHIGMGNIFGNESLIAAYTHGEKWLGELLVYLEDNLTCLENFIKDHIPLAKVTVTEATYLIWMDFRKLGMEDRDLKKFMVRQAGLGLNDGPTFGPGGSGFQRMNIALPREKLTDALNDLRAALARL